MGRSILCKTTPLTFFVRDDGEEYVQQRLRVVAHPDKRESLHYQDGEEYPLYNNASQHNVSLVQIDLSACPHVSPPPHSSLYTLH